MHRRTVSPLLHRLRGACLAAAMAAGAPAAAAPASPEASVTVTVDHAKVIRLPERTQTVIVGNPFIADVSMQKSGVVVLTGKSYGVTNLIALDAGGGMLAETNISVQAQREAVVTVQRGLDRESYSCTPSCQPALQLGVAPAYFTGAAGQAGQRNGLAGSR